MQSLGGRACSPWPWKSLLSLAAICELISFTCPNPYWSQLFISSAQMINCWRKESLEVIIQDVVPCPIPAVFLIPYSVVGGSCFPSLFSPSCSPGQFVIEKWDFFPLFWTPLTRCCWSGHCSSFGESGLQASTLIPLPHTHVLPVNSRHRLLCCRLGWSNLVMMKSILQT